MPRGTKALNVKPPHVLSSRCGGEGLVTLMTQTAMLGKLKSAR
jgi:hypothetical protein